MKLGQKKHIILTGLIGLAMLGVSVAGTVALFTSEVKASASIESGIVKITNKEFKILDATSLNATATKTTHTDTTATFEVGGTAELVDDVLLIEKWVPGDSITLLTGAKNESNVDIKWRASISTSGALAPALQIAVTDTSDVAVTDAEEWHLLAAGEELPGDYKVTISLPETVGNDYQNLSAAIEFGYEAIQGNYVEAPAATINTTIEHGEILYDKDEYHVGDTVEFMIIPDDDYRVDSVTVNGTVITDEDDIYTFVALAENTVVVEIVESI